MKNYLQWNQLSNRNCAVRDSFSRLHIWGFNYNLGLHVVRQHRSGPRSICHRATKTEVADLHVAVRVEEQVGRLDIPVQKI